jgi:hypothetical protein
MKSVTVIADFPDLGLDSVTGTASASTIRSAVSRAIAGIFKTPELKRKRIHKLNLQIAVTNEVQSNG